MTFYVTKVSFRNHWLNWQGLPVAWSTVHQSCMAPPVGVGSTGRWSYAICSGSTWVRVHPPSSHKKIIKNTTRPGPIVSLGNTSYQGKVLWSINPLVIRRVDELYFVWLPKQLPTGYPTKEKLVPSTLDLGSMWHKNPHYDRVAIYRDEKGNVAS